MTDGLARVLLEMDEAGYDVSGRCSIQRLRRPNQENTSSLLDILEQEVDLKYF